MLIGVIGKPNTGKSTFFRAATLADAEIANYPFVTIKPNQGIGYVRVKCVDSEFSVQCNPREGYCIKGERFVPVRMIDVAGLVPGAHEGKGMGNQFLDDLRQADVLIHVIDCSGSTNEKGEPVSAGSYDPANDIRFLENELDLWYLGIFRKVWDKFARQVKQEHQEVGRAIAKQFSGLKVTEKLVDSLIKSLGLAELGITEWSDEQLKALVRELRMATKPIIIAANKVDIDGAADKCRRLQEEFKDYIIVGCSAESELALKEAAKHKLISYLPGDSKIDIIDAEKTNDRQKKGLEFISQLLARQGSTGVQQVLDDAVFKLLGYIAIFPGGVGKLQDADGNYLPDCFLMPPGTTALDFAYRIHSDFGDNFIKAIDVRKRIPVGKDHMLKHRDIIEICSRK